MQPPYRLLPDSSVLKWLSAAFSLLSGTLAGWNEASYADVLSHQSTTAIAVSSRGLFIVVSVAALALSSVTAGIAVVAGARKFAVPTIWASGVGLCIVGVLGVGTVGGFWIMAGVIGLFAGFLSRGPVLPSAIAAVVAVSIFAVGLAVT